MKLTYLTFCSQCNITEENHICKVKVTRSTMKLSQLLNKNVNNTPVRKSNQQKRFDLLTQILQDKKQMQDTYMKQLKDIQKEMSI